MHAMWKRVKYEKSLPLSVTRILSSGGGEEQEKEHAAAVGGGEENSGWRNH